MPWEKRFALSCLFWGDATVQVDKLVLFTDSCLLVSYAHCIVVNFGMFALSLY